MYNRFIDDLNKWQSQSDEVADDAWEYYRDYRTQLRKLRDNAKNNWYITDLQIQNIVTMMQDDNQPEPTIPPLPLLTYLLTTKNKFPSRYLRLPIK